MVPAPRVLNHAAGSISGNLDSILVGIVALAYSAGLLLAIATVAQRIFWHLAGGLSSRLCACCGSVRPDKPC